MEEISLFSQRMRKKGNEQTKKKKKKWNLCLPDCCLSIWPRPGAAEKECISTNKRKTDRQTDKGKHDRLAEMAPTRKKEMCALFSKETLQYILAFGCCLLKALRLIYSLSSVFIVIC